VQGTTPFQVGMDEYGRETTTTTTRDEVAVSNKPYYSKFVLSYGPSQTFSTKIRM
jgi:hypothetical protein